MPVPIYNGTVFNVSDVTNAADRIIRSGEHAEFCNLLNSLRDAPELASGIEPVQVATILSRLAKDNARFIRVFDDFKDKPAFRSALVQAVKQSVPELHLGFTLSGYTRHLEKDRGVKPIDTLRKVIQGDNELTEAFLVGLRTDMDDHTSGKETSKLGDYILGIEKIPELAKIITADDVTRYIDDDNPWKTSRLKELIPFLKDKPGLRAGIKDEHIAVLVRELLKKNDPALTTFEEALKGDDRLYAAFVTAISSGESDKPADTGGQAREHKPAAPPKPAATDPASDRDEGMSFHSSHPRRDFSPFQRTSLERHWDDLPHEDKQVYNDRIVYVTRPGCSITVTSNSIIYTGKASDEAIMKGMEHARDNWLSKAHVNSRDEDFTIRVMAAAELLGIKLTHEHVNWRQAMEYAQRPEFNRAFEAMKAKFPQYARSHENERQREAVRTREMAASRARGNDRGGMER